MPEINIPLNDRQTCWLLNRLDEEIDYFKNLDDATPEDGEMLKSLQQLESEIETTLKRNKR